VNAFRCLFHAAIIGAIVSTQVAAAQPHKTQPYHVDWYLHPQRLMDVGGRRLNIFCIGTGSPSVILEAGLVADAAAWRRVQPAISRTTRVCSYDRAGLGFSDPTGAPRDATAIVRDLHTLLRRAAIAPPYVLVGWSSGGLYTRLYQYRYPSEVTGLVEVDPDTEFDADNANIVATVMHTSREWYQQQVHDWYKQYDNCAINASRGTCAFFLGGLARYHERLRTAGCPAISPAECALAEVRGEHLNRGSLWKDEALELEASEKSSAEVRAAERPYGNLPLIVLTDSEDGDIDYSAPLIISVKAQRAMWVAKDQAEERLAALSSVGAHFVVAGSTHAIQLDHPAVVISAVDEVVAQARYGVDQGAER